MRYLISYVWHYLVSHSRHGTHSPFVYDLADQVIYNSSYSSGKSIAHPVEMHADYQNLLFKILGRLDVAQITDDLGAREVDGYWIKTLKKKDVDLLLNRITEGKIVAIHDPYGKNINKLWKQLTADSRVTVSINLFHFGLLLQRDGQRKENFLLRYPCTSIVKKLR